MEMPIGEFSWGHLHKLIIRPLDILMLNCCQESISLAKSRSKKAAPDFYREGFGHSSPVRSCWIGHRPMTNNMACISRSVHNGKHRFVQVVLCRG